MCCHPHSTEWISVSHWNSWRRRCWSCWSSGCLDPEPHCCSQASMHDCPVHPRLFWSSDTLRATHSVPHSSAHHDTLEWFEVCCSWLRWGQTTCCNSAVQGSKTSAKFSLLQSMSTVYSRMRQISIEVCLEFRQLWTSTDVVKIIWCYDDSSALKVRKSCRSQLKPIKEADSRLAWCLNWIYWGGRHI